MTFGAPSTPHPSAADLRAFNIGRLSDERALVIGTHLEECPACCQALRELPAEDRFVGRVRAAADSSAPRRRSPFVSPPERLGDYHLLREVGRGGMAVVYEAEQRSLGRRVALKVLPIRALSETAAVERFRRESRLAARLHHTNIVPVFEVGQEGDICFYAMQLIPGQSLDRVVAHLRRAAGIAIEDQGSRIEDRGSRIEDRKDETSSDHNPSSSSLKPRSSILDPRTPNRLAYDAVVRVGLQVAQALTYAHARGVLHRDIKPSNLLLDESGVVWVTDFGLAKGLGEDLTHTGDFLGTLRYMAPERFRGACDARADVYGLGLTLYELLTLRPAFADTDHARLIGQVHFKEPPRPRALNPGVPRDLETVVLKAMDKDPARRYQTATELADDLQRLLTGEPVRARRLSSPERLARWCRRYPVVAALSAALLVSLLAGLSGVTLKWREADQARRAAEDESRRYLGLSARLMLERGCNLCDQGEYGNGLLWLARGLEGAADSPEAQQSLRTALGGWARRLHPLQAVLPQGSPIATAAFGPDGKTVLIGSTDGTVQLWGLGSAGDPPADTDRFPCPCWGRPLAPPVQHGKGVTVVAMSPDGRTAASAGHDGTARLLSADTGQPLGEPLHHGAPVRVVVFSSDGHLLLTGGEDRAARLWDVATRQPVGEPLLHQGTVRAAAFGPDGQLLVTSAEDNTARIWRAATGQPVGDVLQHTGRVRSVAFSPDGKTILTGSNDTTACLWNAATGQRLGEPLKHGQPVSAVAFSPDGARLLAAAEDKTARVWDAKTLQPAGPTLRHLDRIFAAAFSPDGKTIVTGGHDDTARLWDAGTGQPIGVPLRHHDDVNVVAFSPDSRRVLTCSEDGLARVWEVSPADHGTRTLGPETKRVVGLTFSRDGRSLWSATGKARRFDLSTGACLEEKSLPGQVLAAVACSPDGATVATASLSGWGQLWDAATGKPRGDPLRHPVPSWVMAVAFSPDGRLLATGGGDFESAKRRGEGQLWEVRSGRLVTRLEGHDREVIAVAFSPDGRTVATGSRDNTARLWDAATGRLEAVIRHRDWVTAVAFSPNGQLILTASQDRTAGLWEAKTGQAVAPPLRHEDSVLAAAFSPDGRLILTGDTVGTVRLWEAPTGAPADVPLRCGTAIRSVAFSPDGGLLAVGGEDGLLRLVPAPVPVTEAPEWVRLWVEVNAGVELSAGGAVVYLTDAAWRERLGRLAGADPFPLP
jgi:WD40 repeat protein/serine/threonine protein kinase